MSSTNPIRIELSTPIHESPRVLQIRGIFDLPPEPTSSVAWEVALPLAERTWHVGLIVGPSGCGKSTVARHLWPEAYAQGAGFTWPTDRSILDAFPPMPVKEIVTLLSSVGFSSPPAWLRPFHVLSTGQQFRATLARLLAASPDLAVLDEFTSVVDRTVAQVGSHALQKTVRSRGQKFIAVTCHEDVEPWLQPDWVYRPAEQHFAWRLLQRRPPLNLTIQRVYPAAWSLFRHHHYLSHTLNPSAVCFVAFLQNRPVAFSAWLPFFGNGPPARREHRTVTLPDFQGIGIGHALSTFCASLWKSLGYRAVSTTTHPAMIAARMKSNHWLLTRAPSLAASHESKVQHATTRLTAGFRYIGPPLTPTLAKQLLTL